jgi:hypothetical protein
LKDGFFTHWTWQRQQITHLFDLRLELDSTAVPKTDSLKFYYQKFSVNLTISFASIMLLLFCVYFLDCFFTLRGVTYAALTGDAEKKIENNNCDLQLLNKNCKIIVLSWFINIFNVIRTKSLLNFVDLINFLNWKHAKMGHSG